MKIPSCRIPLLHKAAAKERGRYAMEGVYCERVEGVDGSPAKMICAATDGRRLAVAEFEAHPEDVTGIVPAEAFAAACKAERPREVAPEDFHALISNGCAKVIDGDTVTERKKLEGEFPRYRAVVVPRSEVCVAFDVKLLAGLVEAIGAGGANKGYAKLYFRSNGKGGIDRQAAIRVETGGEAFGVLMPMRIDR